MLEPRLAEQFQDLDKQTHAYRLGMWGFLASEALLFAGLFGLYGAYRVMYPVEFAAAAAHDNIVIGSVNTMILITSSLTVALSLHEVRADRPRAAGLCLVVSILLGMAFLALKATEYGEHFREGILPGSHYHDAALPAFGHKIFFTMYYLTTGLHALHVIAGLSLLAWIAVKCFRRQYSAESCTSWWSSGAFIGISSIWCGSSSGLSSIWRSDGYGERALQNTLRRRLGAAARPHRYLVGRLLCPLGRG